MERWRHKKWLCFVCAVILLGFIQSFAFEQRPMTVDDALNIVSVRDVLLSPDGQRIMFRAPYQTVEGGKFELRNGSFWLLSMKTGEFRRLKSQNQGESYGGAKDWTPWKRPEQ